VKWPTPRSPLSIGGAAAAPLSDSDKPSIDQAAEIAGALAEPEIEPRALEAILGMMG
jgi:hypothetical protein